MAYSELMIRPMREELTRIGVEEMRTPEDVEKTLENSHGTVMVVVNSICGCAAGKATAEEHHRRTGWEEDYLQLHDAATGSG
jgi:putative YphP/YqiW family bacilliredoxin